MNLKKRMIYLGPEDVKEGHWKRVPIHDDLVPVLEEVMKVQAIGQGPRLLAQRRAGDSSRSTTVVLGQESDQDRIGPSPSIP